MLVTSNSINNERLKPTLSQVIGKGKQGFIGGGDETGNLILVKEIRECCNEKDAEACIIMMDFMKAHDQIERKK